MSTESVAALEKQLDAVLAVLLEATHASRTTVRIDDPARKWEVNFVCGEALKPGVKPLRGDGSIDQRGAATVHWMDKHRRILVQPDLTNNPDPAPPAALLSAYAAKAQMLSPLFNRDGFLQGWISMHYVDGPHQFTDSEIAAAEKATVEIKKIAGI